MTKILVAYFSATGVTEKVAKRLAEAVGGDIYEIRPTVKYTDDDLDWTNEKSRSTIECKDPKSRPEMIKEDPNIHNYDTILLAFPIWWYTAPKIIFTFLEAYDFKNKRIFLFATSGSSHLGKTADDLRPLLDKSATIANGAMLNGGPSKEKISGICKNLGIL